MSNLIFPPTPCPCCRAPAQVPLLSDYELHCEACKLVLNDPRFVKLRSEVPVGKELNPFAVAFGRAVEAAVRAKLGVAAPMQLVGYYHKATSGDPDEDDMFFADAINGDCPDCHPLYMDASVTLTAKAERVPMTVEQQTEAAKAMSVKARQDPHIISFMMGIEAAESHHGVVGKEGA